MSRAAQKRSFEGSSSVKEKIFFSPAEHTWRMAASDAPQSSTDFPGAPGAHPVQ